MTPLVLRALAADAVPPPGELWVCPRQGDCRSLAGVVLGEGLAALRQGEGAVATIVVPIEPTLDVMLAALFCQQLLAGASLPPGCQVFARYAALVREGLKPSSMPLEDSLEGVYLAARSLAGESLTDEATQRAFLGQWEQMGRRILEAARAEQDPFETSLIVGRSEFARERAFLLRDNEIYYEDVRSGERWNVAFPERPKQPVPALLLKKPRSVLFKYWSRLPHPRLGLPPFQLLAVQVKANDWIVSTDPIHRLSLKELAETLQKAELAHNAAAGADPWFDGRPFAHTLVAAPRSGSKLSDKEVLAVLRGWRRAPGGVPSRAPRYALVAALLGAVLLVGVFAWTRGFGRWRDEDGKDLGAARDKSGPGSTRDLDFDPSSEETTFRNLYVVTVGVSRYHATKLNLQFAHRDAEEIASVLSKQQGSLFENVHIETLIDEKATRKGILEALGKLMGAGGPTQHDLVFVAFAGHGANLEAEDDEFYFLPHDFDPSSRIDSGVYWAHMRIVLKSLPCPVILFLDTCHSGSVTGGLRSAGEVQRDVKTKWNRSTGDWSKATGKRGIFVLSACMGNESAREHRDWKHGAMTLAFLEAMEGARRVPGDKETAPPGLKTKLNLKKLDDYITDRVNELADGRQAVVSNQTGNLPLQRIFLRAAK